MPAFNSVKKLPVQTNYSNGLTNNAQAAGVATAPDEPCYVSFWPKWDRQAKLGGHPIRYAAIVNLFLWCYAALSV
jgi:hypothetical protein